MSPTRFTGGKLSKLFAKYTKITAGTGPSCMLGDDDTHEGSIREYEQEYLWLPRVLLGC
jgi:hypothetical protein